MAPTGPQPNPQATAQRASDPGAVAPGSVASTPKKPQYDFYSLLSEREVRIPDAVISAQARAEQHQGGERKLQIPIVLLPQHAHHPMVQRGN